MAIQLSAKSIPYFLTIPACFNIPIFSSNFNSYCSNLLDTRNFQEQVKKAFSKILKILGLQPRISKVFLDQQNNFFSQKVRTILDTKYQTHHFLSMILRNFRGLWQLPSWLQLRGGWATGFLRPRGWRVWRGISDPHTTGRSINLVVHGVCHGGSRGVMGGLPGRQGYITRSR